MKSDLVNLNNKNSEIILDLRYATKNNFTNKILYKTKECLIHKVAYEHLCIAEDIAKKSNSANDVSRDKEIAVSEYTPNAEIRRDKYLHRAIGIANFQGGKNPTLSNPINNLNQQYQLFVDYIHTYFLFHKLQHHHIQNLKTFGQ